MIPKITLNSVIVINNISAFNDKISMEVTFSTTKLLSEPIQWKIVYVGSALSEDYDQVLE